MCDRQFESVGEREPKGRSTRFERGTEGGESPPAAQLLLPLIEVVLLFLQFSRKVCAARSTRAGGESSHPTAERTEPTAEVAEPQQFLELCVEMVRRDRVRIDAMS